MGNAGNINRISLCPKKEYTTTNPKMGRSNRRHCASNQKTTLSRSFAVFGDCRHLFSQTTTFSTIRNVDSGTNNSVNNILLGKALVKYQCHGESPHSLDFPRIVLK
mmetsp:Transcript_9553/g.28510  ORF Transcript_9553/g.28510 Transcript_9553/m.28510 type:complete len:106 (+) Transcript_9553:1366-1683(+)